MTDSSLGPNETMPFGKYRGTKIEELLKSDPAYLVWLREQRKTSNGDSKFFTGEVSRQLDFVIAESKSLQKKYKTWDIPLAAPAPKAPEALTPVRSHAANYAESWGSF